MMNRPYDSSKPRQAPIKVTGWICLACELSGEFVPALDVDGFKVEDALHAVVNEHFDRTTKEARHGAAIAVRL